jgi:Tfp pilus assembly protein PilX
MHERRPGAILVTALLWVTVGALVALAAVRAVLTVTDHPRSTNRRH